MENKRNATRALQTPHGPAPVRIPRTSRFWWLSAAFGVVACNATIPASIADAQAVDGEIAQEASDAPAIDEGSDGASDAAQDGADSGPEPADVPTPDGDDPSDVSELDSTDTSEFDTSDDAPTDTPQDGDAEDGEPDAPDGADGADGDLSDTDVADGDVLPTVPLWFGSVLREDRLYDAEGFTGETTLVPARFVRVDLLATDGSVVESTHTDDFGAWQFQSNRLDAARVQVWAESTADWGDASVKPASGRGAVYSMNTALVEGGPTPVAATLESPLAGALNIVDVTNRAFEFMFDLVGNPSPSLTYRWTPGTPFSCGSCYGDGVISLGGHPDDPDEFDDDIILHEIGHHMVASFSRDSSPGGSHRDRYVSPALAYGEGIAYFFTCWVNNSPIVVDNYRDSIRVWDFERVWLDGTEIAQARGTTNGSLSGNMREELVVASLWDLYDGTGEPADLLELGTEPIFGVFRSLASSDPRDTGPRGVDFSDFLARLVCDAGVSQDAILTLTAERAYPWEGVDCE